MTREELEERKNVRALLDAQVARSVTSAAADGRTVERPVDAAWYVGNALTQRPDLLARLAVAFARADVEAFLAEAT